MANKRLGADKVLFRVSRNLDNIGLPKMGDPGKGTLHTFKVQRNKPCSCGSGKKYKHCHMVQVDISNPFHEIEKKPAE